VAGPGDDVLLGASNDAGSTTTSLLSTTSIGPTLYIDNRDNRHALRLSAATGEPAYHAASGGGQIGLSSRGDPVLLGPGGAAHVYTARWATRTVPLLQPTRVLDTRTGPGRSRIIAGLEHLDPAGRIRAGRTIVIGLGDFVGTTFGHAARATVTVANTTGGGYLTVWGRGSRPTISSLNWWAAGQVLSNTVLTQLGYAIVGSDSSAVAIYASSPAAVVVDLVATIEERGGVSAPLPPTVTLIW
jgi:hypothetical protein